MHIANAFTNSSRPIPNTHRLWGGSCSPTPCHPVLPLPLPTHRRRTSPFSPRPSHVLSGWDRLFKRRMTSDDGSPFPWVTWFWDDPASYTGHVVLKWPSAIHWPHGFEMTQRHALVTWCWYDPAPYTGHEILRRSSAVCWSRDVEMTQRSSWATSVMTRRCSTGPRADGRPSVCWPPIRPADRRTPSCQSMASSVTTSCHTISDDHRLSAGVAMTGLGQRHGRGRGRAAHGERACHVHVRGQR